MSHDPQDAKERKIAPIFINRLPRSAIGSHSNTFSGVDLAPHDNGLNYHESIMTSGFKTGVFKLKTGVSNSNRSFKFRTRDSNSKHEIQIQNWSYKLLQISARDLSKPLSLSKFRRKIFRLITREIPGRLFAMTSETFTEVPFWSAFRADLKKAEGHVIIQSPFVSNRRLKYLANDLLELNRRGVTVCVFVQQPRKWGPPPNQLSGPELCEITELKANLDLLKSLNVHLNLKEKIHSKFAIIDQRILWEGSLNILSHTGNSEHMRRWDNREEVDRIIEQHLLLHCADCKQIIGLFCPGYPNTTTEALGAQIKRHRLEAAMSLRELEAQSGISRRAIGQVERGNGSTHTVVEILNNLGMHLCLVENHLVPSIAQKLLHAMYALNAPQTQKRQRKRTNIRSIGAQEERASQLKPVPNPSTEQT